MTQNNSSDRHDGTSGLRGVFLRPMMTWSVTAISICITALFVFFTSQTMILSGEGALAPWLQREFQLLIALAVVVNGLIFYVIYSIQGLNRRAVRIAADMTRELKVRTEELEKSRKTLSMVQDALDRTAIIAITDAKGRITYANDRFCEVSKYSREELLGQDHRIINSGFHTKEFWKNFWETIQSGKIWRGEIRNRAKDGSYYWVDTAIVPVIGDNGRPEQFMAFRFLITDRKEAEGAMIRITEELRRSAQVKTEFVAMVSHELRTPLTVIREGIALVADQTLGPLLPDQAQYLQIAQRNTDRLARLINDVLDYQKLEAGQIKTDIAEQNLNALIEENLPNLLPIVKKGDLSLRTDLEPDLPPIRLDRDKITQVLVNLVSNAAKFTAKGEIMIRTRREGNAIRMSVIDQGIGIKPEDISKLFQTFSQIQNQGMHRTGGTGLGLVICKKIMDLHRGKIGVESEWGKGSVFYVLLPIMERRA